MSVSQSTKRYITTIWPVAVVVGLAIAVHARSVLFDFIYDDWHQIVENPWLRSWRYVPRYFTSQVWAFETGARAGSYWRPAFLLWLRSDYAIFALDPFGWHVASVMLHAGVTAAVFWLVQQLSKERWTALAAAAMFAVHPVTIETAAWVSGVTDSLMAFGVLTALALWLRARSPSYAAAPSLHA